MNKTKYNIQSPDGFNISMYDFPTREKAIAYLDEWIKKFEIQGYYSTSNREQIAIEDLKDCCSLMEYN